MENGTGSQKIQMENRQQCYVTGVTDTISFDEKEVWIVTSKGTVHIKGNELHVKRLSLEKGELLLDGVVDSLAYTDDGARKEKGKSLIKRMFG